MASYPSLPHDISSRRTPRSGLLVDVSASGRPRARSLYSANYYELRILHVGLSEADRDSVLDHYDANRDEQFGYIWPDGSITMLCVYGEAPAVEWTPGGWTVTVLLVGRNA